MTTKTTKTPKTRAKKTRKPATIEIRIPEGKDLGTVIRDAHLANERQAYDGLNAMVAMGGPGMDFLRTVVAHTVVSAAEQVLRIEDGLRLAPNRKDRIEEDLKLTREHYTRTLTEARKTLGADFDSLYEAQRVEHNEGARMSLDSSNGMGYCYVVPKFYDDGTHEPLGPRDFPWGQQAQT